MSDTAATLAALHAAAARELTAGILPYWMTRAVDARHGGFVGLVDADEVPHPEAPRGAILNARILWTFSAAYRALGDPRYREAADRAARFVRERLLDARWGGVYWAVGADGRPRDARKHVYAQAFAIYALAEHARATGDAESLRDAVALFGLIEQHARDAEWGGYEEAFTRDWVRLDDVRLSDADANERKSMNTHLHVLEAYAGLYRAWPDPGLRARVAAVVGLFLDHIVDARTGQLRLFFERDWAPRSAAVSYGHDIEASWLLLDAADAIDDAALRARVAPVSAVVAAAVLREAYDAERGGVYYERAQPGGGDDTDPVDAGSIDTDKEWWPQAEAVVGFLGAWQETGRAAFLDAARGTWGFIERHLVDRAHGEWYRRTARDGAVRPGYEKVGPWKCPYHNGRACLEVMARTAPAVRVPNVGPAGAPAVAA